MLRVWLNSFSIMSFTKKMKLKSFDAYENSITEFGVSQFKSRSLFWPILRSWSKHWFNQQRVRTSIGNASVFAREIIVALAPGNTQIYEYNKLTQLYVYIYIKSKAYTHIQVYSGSYCFWPKLKNYEKFEKKKIKISASTSHFLRRKVTI